MTNIDRISQVFKGQHVFITGASGFMGQTFLERLLRVTEVEKIYLLLRTKKGKQPEERIKDLLSNGLFDTLKQQSNFEKVSEKIKIIEGDCSVINLGIEDKNWSILCENVTLIYHFAATTRFDEKLKSATNLNLRGTHEMIKLARECKKLLLFCHISTAYCHLSEKFLLEKPYAPPYEPHEFMEHINQLTENEAEIYKKKCLSQTIPNTYVLTKALAESLVVEALEKYQLPVLILRPSIVTPTLSNPIQGWCPDFNGLGGLLIAVGKGVMRTMYCNVKYHGDFLPVDVATGGIMITTWSYLSLNDHKNFIFNFTTSNQIALNWKEIIDKGLKVCREKYPMRQMLWYPNITLTDKLWLHKTRTIFYHWIPAIIIDSFLFCIRIKPFLWRVHKKIAKGMDAVETFANSQWDFDNSNMLKLRTKMNEIELQNYKVTIDNVNVDEYVENSVFGGHKFLMKNSCDEKDFERGRKIVKIVSNLKIFL
ncbi:hypothetical protein PVAND_012479 [Polypedilum vanderplanki]|uniref:Fatty acyl-CoA reductase n=1 Tax=Polypedilum vanderplanki TaxID=319348 RepID=A0A9J6CMV1_POLVA|nr:hypothetical protein PVAND_012479 [Polypedilum vanderplanki]